MWMSVALQSMASPSTSLTVEMAFDVSLSRPLASRLPYTPPSFFSSTTDRPGMPFLDTGTGLAALGSIPIAWATSRSRRRTICKGPLPHSPTVAVCMATYAAVSNAMSQAIPSTNQSPVKKAQYASKQPSATNASFHGRESPNRCRASRSIQAVAAVHPMATMPHQMARLTNPGGGRSSLSDISPATLWRLGAENTPHHGYCTWIRKQQMRKTAK